MLNLSQRNLNGKTILVENLTKSLNVGQLLSTHPNDELNTQLPFHTHVMVIVISFTQRNLAA